MTEKSVHLCLLAYSGETHNPVMTSLMHAIELITKQKGWKCSFSVRGGDSIIPRARNSSIAAFMATEATDFVFVDSDNYCSGEDLVRLLEHDADVVAAPCRSRCDPITWPVRWLHHGMKIEPSGLMEVESVGTGIIRITRRCVEQMIADCADRWYDDSAPGGKAWPLFEYAIEGRSFWGEDLVFCRKWRALGGKVYIDPSITCGHIGKVAFTSSVNAWLSEMPPLVEIVDKADGTVTLVDNPISKYATETAVGDVTGRVSVCLATRGRPEVLKRTLEMMVGTSALDDTRFVIGMDEDDSGYLLLAHPKVLPSVAPREDSLGEKYNRCFAQAPKADLYVAATDDSTICTSGWDKILLARAKETFPDGIGAVYFGKMPVPSSLPAAYALTPKFVEKQGFLAPPYFPFWWHDTWTDELAQMIGRVAYADVKMAFPDNDQKTRGARDIVFWAQLFEATRPQRVSAALAIINGDDFQETDARKAELRRAIAPLCRAFQERQAMLLDPVRAQNLERVVGFDAPQDERYARLKSAATRMMNELSARAAA